MTTHTPTLAHIPSGAKWHVRDTFARVLRNCVKLETDAYPKLLEFARFILFAPAHPLRVVYTHKYLTVSSRETDM